MAPNNNTQKAWHSVRRASQQSQPNVTIEDSMDLGAVCETPSTAKTPIREAFDNIYKSSSTRQSSSQKKASSSSSQNNSRKQQESRKEDDDDGEMEFSFSDLEEEDQTTTEKKQQVVEKQFEPSPLLYSSESDAPASKKASSSSNKKAYQPTQEQAASNSEKEDEEEKQTKPSNSRGNSEGYSQYFTPSEDEKEKDKEGYSLRKTPTRVYQEKKKRKKMIKKKEVLISSDEEDDQVVATRNDRMYDSDEIPDEDIDAMEEQEKARKKKQPQTEEERREQEKQEEERKKAELKLRKKKLSELSNSIRKKNQHKSIYIEEDDTLSKDLFASGKRKSTFDNDELYSQPSSQEEDKGEVFSSPKKRLKKKSGSPVASAPIVFDKEDSDSADSEELENLAKEIRENNPLLSSKKKKKPLALKTQKRRSYSSSEEEAPRRKSRKSRDSDDEDDGEVTMSQFIVSDEEEDEEPEYNVYRMVDMMDNDMDSQEFHSILTSNIRLSSDFKSSFAIYIQLITSHLLDEDFIKSLKFKDRTHFANASKMVEGKLETVKDSLIYSSAWKSRHKNLLQFYPIIKAREISLKDTEIDNMDKCCQACGRKNHQAEYTLIFKPPRATTKYEFSSGAHINWIDSPEEKSDEEENDFIQLSQRRAVTGKKCKYTKEKSFVGSTCYKRSLLYHSFQHYKFHLIQHIIHKIDKIATSYAGEEEITSDYILERIVSKKGWIESLYKKYLKLIEEAEAGYTKSKDAGVIDVVDELFDVYDSEEEVHNNSDPEEQDNDFIVTNTRGGLRLKRTKPKSDDELDKEDGDLIDPIIEEKPKEKPKPRELKLSFALSPIPVVEEDDEKDEDKELDFLDKEEDQPPSKQSANTTPSNSKKKEEEITDLSGYLDSSDDDILNYNII